MGCCLISARIPQTTFNLARSEVEKSDKQLLWSANDTEQKFPDGPSPDVSCLSTFTASHYSRDFFSFKIYLKRWSRKDVVRSRGDLKKKLFGTL